MMSTINKTVLAKLLAIDLAENVFGWVSRGTHHYDKFVKPEELHDMFKSHNLIPIRTSGLALNPLKNKWSLTSNTTVNYITVAVRGLDPDSSREEATSPGQSA